MIADDMSNYDEEGELRRLDTHKDFTADLSGNTCPTQWVKMGKYWYEKNAFVVYLLSFKLKKSKWNLSKASLL